jgi:hypothetical protein
MPEVTYEIVEHDGGGLIRSAACFRNPSQPMPRRSPLRRRPPLSRKSPATQKPSSMRTRRASGTRKQRAVETARTPSSRIRISYFSLARGAGAHSGVHCTKPIPFIGGRNRVHEVLNRRRFPSSKVGENGQPNALKCADAVCLIKKLRFSRTVAARGLRLRKRARRKNVGTDSIARRSPRQPCVLLSHTTLGAAMP